MATIEFEWFACSGIRLSQNPSIGREFFQGLTGSKHTVTRIPQTWNNVAIFI